MSLLSVKEEFKKYGIEDKILEFDLSSATVSEAAKRLDCKEQEIAKTMSFIVNDKVIIIVLAGDAKIDNSKYKHTFGEKAHMVPGSDVLEKIGHPVGGVCPFAVNEGVEIYLDESLKRFETVFPACGSTNNAIELTIKELEDVTNYLKWIDVCKLKEE